MRALKPRRGRITQVIRQSSRATTVSGAVGMDHPREFNTGSRGKPRGTVEFDRNNRSVRPPALVLGCHCW